METKNKLTKKLRIKIICSNYPDRQYRVKKIFIHEQAQEFLEQGVDLEIIDITDKKGKSFNEVFEKVPVRRIRTTCNFRILKSLIKIANVLHYLYKNRKGFEIIHLHFLTRFSIFFAIFGKFLMKRVGLTAYGVDVFPTKNSIEELYRTITFYFIDIVFAISDFTGSLVEKYTNSKKVNVVYRGVKKSKVISVENIEQKQARKKLNLLNDAFILLVVCDLIERKGVDIVISSFARLIKENDNCLLIIIGKGKEKEKLQRLTLKNKISDKIIFIEYIEDDKELFLYYKASDLYIMMSKTIESPLGVEGFGISYIEASAVGIPVIGGKSGGVSSAVKENITGFLISPEAPDVIFQVYSKMFLLLNNSEKRKVLGQNGKAWVFNNLLWEHNVKRIKDIYINLWQTS